MVSAIYSILQYKNKFYKLYKIMSFNKRADASVKQNCPYIKAVDDTCSRLVEFIF